MLCATVQLCEGKIFMYNNAYVLWDSITLWGPNFDV